MLSGNKSVSGTHRLHSHMINSIHLIDFNAPELSKVLNLKLERGVFRTVGFYFLEQNVVLNFREKKQKILLHRSPS